jgi:hypothetical protein
LETALPPAFGKEITLEETLITTIFDFFFDHSSRYSFALLTRGTKTGGEKEI